MNTATMTTESNFTRDLTLKRLRGNHHDEKSAPLLFKKQKVEIVAQTDEEINQSYHWGRTEGTLQISNKRDGSQYIRYVKDRKNLFTTLCEFKVVDSWTFEDGNLNVPVYEYGRDRTVYNPKKAKYRLLLTTHYPEKLKERETSMLSEQKDCFKWVEDKVEEILTMAHDQEICQTAHQGDFKQFMNVSTSFVKGSTIELKRNLCDFQGNATPIRYWKKTAAGDFHRFFPTEIPKDSVVMATMNPRMYNFKENSSGRWKHGVVGDLGQDVIVIWMPKARSLEEIKEVMKRAREEVKERKQEKEEDERKHRRENPKDVLQDIPFIEF